MSPSVSFSFVSEDAGQNKKQTVRFDDESDLSHLLACLSVSDTCYYYYYHRDDVAITALCVLLSSCC